VPQIVYALVFEGTSSGDAPHFRGRTEAPSLSATSVVGPGGVRTTLREVPGGRARLESAIEQKGATTFTEAGTITFGDGDDALRFSTIGEGWIDGDPETGLSGAVMWRVDGGTGAFHGATGLITSNFSIVYDRVTDHHWGVIELPDPHAPPLPSTRGEQP
jgi:hypothetical protein